MIVPRFINESIPNVRGIVPGWYAMDDSDGGLSSGPFASHAECVRKIIRPTSGPILYFRMRPWSKWTCLPLDVRPSQLLSA
jgi:hypothetical protein